MNPSRVNGTETETVTVTETEPEMETPLHRATKRERVETKARDWQLLAGVGVSVCVDYRVIWFDFSQILIHSVAHSYSRSVIHSLGVVLQAPRQ